MVSNFANVFKTMTPLPKLNQNFSAIPSSRSGKADLGNEQMQTEQSSQRNKMVHIGVGSGSAASLLANAAML